MISTIIITGPPASGKSTLRRSLKAIYNDGNTLSIGVDDVLREMYRAGLLRDIATISKDGALILWKRGPELDESMRRLLDARLHHPGFAIIEAPIHEAFFGYLLEECGHTAALSAVLCLEAPLAVRLARNERRGRDSIAPTAVKAMASQLPSEQMHRLRMQAYTVGIFNNADRPFSEVSLEVRTWLRSHADM